MALSFSWHCQKRLRQAVEPTVINTKNAVRNKYSEQTVFLPEDGGCCVPGKQNIFFYY